MMAVLGRAQILTAIDLKQERVDVAEWGGEVIVRELNAADVSEFMAMTMTNVDVDLGTIRDAHGLFDSYIWVAARSMVDDNGDPLFDGEADLAALARKNIAPIRRVAEVAMRLSGLEKGAKAEAEKKS
jgi:hypothetical protein